MNSTVWAIVVAALMLVFLWQNRGVRKAFNAATTATDNLLDAHITTARTTAQSLNRIELAAARRDLASLQEVVDLKAQQGMTISPDSLVVIEQAKQRIGELTSELSHEDAQTVEANATREGTNP